MFVVIAKAKAKDGEADRLGDILSSMVDWVIENEADTITYICNRSVSDPNEFCFFERYTSEKAFEAHSQTDRIKAMGKEIRDLIDGPITLDTYTEVAGKL